jgi:hypothetical protein
MGASSRFFGYIVKLLFGLSIVGLGISGLQNAHQAELKITISINNIATMTKLPVLAKLNDFASILKYVDSALLVIAGLLLVLNFKGAGFFGFLAIAFQLALIYNPFFFSHPRVIEIAVRYVAVLGGILTVA